MTNGVVDQDHHELPEASRVAADHRRFGIDHDPDTAVRRGLGHRRRSIRSDVAKIDRNPLEGDRARIGPGEQQQILHDRGHVANLVIDILERGADPGDRLVAVARQVLDAAPDDGQRRAQLVARIGGELALAA